MFGKKSLILAIPILLGLLFGSISLIASNASFTTVAAPAVTIPALKLPWDRSFPSAIFTSGPHGAPIDYSCNSRTILPLTNMSGLDFGMSIGTKVLSVADGVVVRADSNDTSIGGIVTVDHGTGLATGYWHLSQISVQVGMHVMQGTILGKSGSQKGAAHLHLEFRNWPSNTSYSAHSISIDGYTAWAYVRLKNSSTGWNYRGTLTRGAVTQKIGTECGESIYKMFGSAGTLDWTQSQTVSSTNMAVTTRLGVTISVPAIGADTAHGNNNNPRHPNRSMQVQLRNSNNTLVVDQSIPVSYSNTTGLFSGALDLGQTFPSGTYTVRLIFIHALSHTLGRFVITNGAVATLPSFQVKSGDIYIDNQVDGIDYNTLLRCYGSKQCPSDQKVASDLNDDGAVDGADYNILLRYYGQHGD